MNLSVAYAKISLTCSSVVQQAVSKQEKAANRHAYTACCVDC